ncbi:hypothetical protein FGG08_000291 [Glutinoglossum americanum]|uniref:Sm domain-containing protein n=1 Tax=Glutinoglossum americanum TaxID=1670608 RepID=A0A9P8IAL1_9PEZI|nr:hypothetical protein FGG08_000291 [Glutinoglossum americanum]
MGSIGIPIKLLNEAQGHVVTLEITSGQVYRGKLLEAEDNMNVQLKDITVTARDGRVSHLDQVYIRGSHVRFFIVPDMLRRGEFGLGRGMHVMTLGKVQGDKLPWYVSSIASYQMLPESVRVIQDFIHMNGKGQQLRSVEHLVPAQNSNPLIRSRPACLDQNITGSAPTQTSETPAGLSHVLELNTTYYKASIPIWVDQIPDGSHEEWTKEYLKADAKDVLKVLGAFVLVFRKPVDQGAMEGVKMNLKAISTVVEKGCGYNWDGICLAVGMAQSETPHLQLGFEEWEDVCREFQFEYVDSEAKGRNEFGEPVGLERIKEALEANDWAADDDVQGIDGPDDEDCEQESGFGTEAAEMEREMLGLKLAIYGGGGEAQGLEGGEEEEERQEQELQVEHLEAVMLRMQAIKVADMSADLPEPERKRFAAKAVSDIMKTL